MRYLLDLSWEPNRTPPTLLPGQVFKVITPERCILIVDDNVDMRYLLDLSWEPNRTPPTLLPGQVFKVITPERRILIVDDNLDFQVMTEEEYEAMSSLCHEPARTISPSATITEIDISYIPYQAVEHIDINCIVSKNGIVFNLEDENA